ncbi:O-fucosyltransferase family protein [Phanerochaete sordida]|uniref:O-fucosyltransferase family protein n=1 Tax=Phanerochaete sordida TaxID=48140 RepID=A0A9P3GFB5_9APHY|nr:O-fucosyltransferase family protein [Phanerochaete sordida]
MFEQNGRNRHGRDRLAKPVMYDPADSEWGILSPRPLNRWAKKRPTKRVMVLLVCIFIGCVYGVRVWRERQYFEEQREQRQLDYAKDQGSRQRVEHKEEHKEKKPAPPVDPNDPYAGRPKPPLFGKYHQAELAMPQHHVADPFANGKKYLWVENHVHGLGWGNHLQDLVFNAQLSYSAGRAFVFDNYTWNRDGSIYSDFNGKLIPSQIPLSALITSPINGGPYFENDAKLRGIQREYWHKICPEPKLVSTYDVKKLYNGNEPSALTILNTWVDVLSKIEEPCVKIDGYTERIFDMYMYGQKERLLDIWPVLRESPIVKLFGYSPLIHATYEANRHLFTTLPFYEPYFPCSAVPGSTTDGDLQKLPPARCSDPYQPIPGLLALHLRRGDFADHCQNLARWNAAWMGFNSFPSFPDQWVRPESGGNGESTPENMDMYMRRCYPSIEQIVARLQEVRAHPASKGLKDVYIMTNGKPDWVDELKGAMRAMGGWDKIASSRDMTLDAEQKEVAQAVDMMVGERAQVIIGNGWSSMTSNIVMMRMVRGLAPETNRFW